MSRSRPSRSSVSSVRSPRERPEAGSSSISRLRLGGERHRERDLPVLAVRERADELAELVDRWPPGRPPRAPARGISRSRLRVEHRPQMAALDADDREVDVVLDAQPEEEPRLLVRAGEAELAPDGGPAAIVTSWPNISTVPEVGREVTGDDVEERRLPGAVRAEDRAALARRDVEVDIAYGVKPAEAPADPPQAEGRPGAFGLSVAASIDCLATTYLMTPLTTGRLLADPRQAPLRGTAAAMRPGGGDVCLNVPPNDWSTFGMYWIVFDLRSCPAERRPGTTTHPRSPGGSCPA